ncbi:MAG: hypothetical protein ACREHD_09410, partial [Pirellulales bacterium]
FHLACEALWKMTGPCHLAAVVIVPVSAVCLVWVGVRRVHQGERGSAAVLFGFCTLLAGTVAVLAITPFCVEDQPGTLNHLRWAYTPARYGLCFLSVAALAFVWFLQQCSEKAASFGARRLRVSAAYQGMIKGGFQGLLVAGLGWQIYRRLFYLYYHTEATAPPDLIGAAAVALTLLAACSLATEVWRAVPGHRRALAAIAAIGILVAASAGTAMLSRHWQEGYAGHYDALLGTRVFTRLADGAGRTVAVLDHRPYPFFGSARQHHVVSPRILTTYADLVRYLEARNPDVVASPRRNIAPVFDRYEQGPEWLKTHPGDFTPVMTSGEFNLFTFHGPAALQGSRNASDGVPHREAGTAAVGRIGGGRMRPSTTGGAADVQVSQSADEGVREREALARKQ